MALKLLACLMAGCLLLVACGGSPNYRRQLSKDIQPVVAALAAATCGGESREVSASPVQQQVRPAAETFSVTLVSQSWPADARADVHQLALDASRMATDIATRNETGYVDHLNAEANDLDLVLGDLHEQLSQLPSQLVPTPPC